MNQRMPKKSFHHILQPLGTGRLLNLFVVIIGMHLIKFLVYGLCAFKGDAYTFWNIFPVF